VQRAPRGTELFPYLKSVCAFGGGSDGGGEADLQGCQTIGLRLNCTQKERDTMWVSGW